MRWEGHVARKGRWAAMKIAVIRYFCIHVRLIDLLTTVWPPPHWARRLKLLVCTLKVAGSKLARDFHHPDGGFKRLFISQGECWYGALKLATTAISSLLSSYVAQLYFVTKYQQHEVRWDPSENPYSQDSGSPLATTVPFPRDNYTVSFRAYRMTYS